MAAISSLVGSIPQIGPTICRDDGYSKRRAKNSVVSIISPRLPLFSSQTRRLLQVGLGKSILPRKKRNSWEQCISIFGEPLTGAPFPRKYNGISSSFCRSRSSSWQSKSCLRLRTSTPSAFPDRTSFCLSNRKLEKAFVKDLHIPYATVGPDEPHAASTSWPDGILEKQELDLVYPGVEQTEVEGFLSSELPSHPKLYRGQLKNGLRYLILPNKVPPNRFEAHMEVHVGSIDEEEDEQGIAHMIEHVAFLGSKKREKLLGTGARSNAYTDFHHTVFHIHSPLSTKIDTILACGGLVKNPLFIQEHADMIGCPIILLRESEPVLSGAAILGAVAARKYYSMHDVMKALNALGQVIHPSKDPKVKKYHDAKYRIFRELYDQQLSHRSLMAEALT